MKGTAKFFVLLMTLVVCSTVVFANGQPEDDSVILGNLTNHTGPFGNFGVMFDAAVDLSFEAINADPPLGTPWVAIHQDVGTIGEAQATRKLIESDGADIILNISHEYPSYRDWVMSVIAETGLPLMPSVHGGGIRGDWGGTAAEPLFRGGPMDQSQAVAAMVQAKNDGAERVALLATEIEGSQAQMEAAILAAELMGLEIVDTLNVQPEQANYRSEIARIANSNPDTLVAFTQAQDGGTIVKQSAEAGLSLRIVGTIEWTGDAFASTATYDAMAQHKSVVFAGFTYVDGPAYADFSQRWIDAGYLDIAQPENSYIIQFWDLLNVSALAVEKAGEVNASSWQAAMRDVAMAPGVKVNTYQEGIDALRAGKDIDWEGVTGSFDYNETGMVSGNFGIFKWDDGSLVKIKDLDGAEVLMYETR